MTDIKSQDALNAQGRETDVLIATLNKCQDIVRKNVELENENKRIKELLKECYTVVDTRMLNLRGLYNTDNLEVYKRKSEHLKKLLINIEDALK